MFGISASAAAKIASLDAVTSNIMIADANLNIRYMNAAVTSLLEEAETDLRKELPNFDTRRLIGANIDTFHKNPGHQRQMLAALQRQHRATIWIGHRAFDLIVTPLRNGDKTTGFVVEWANAKERLQNLDFQNQLEAIGRAQATVAFSPDGDILEANSNFLNVLGYTIDEIKGRKHSIFVDSAYAASSSYKTFWSELRAGKFQAAEFIRYGKNGKKVVINASYNPVYDEKGRVAKIVKFATDVTERVRAVDTIGTALSRLASGDLSFELIKPFAPDFEALRRNFNQAICQLRGTLTAVSDATGKIDTGSREITQSAHDLSRRTEQQAASLEETATALDEITANVRNASARAEEARQATETAHASAKRSGEIVSEAIGAMSRIESSSEQITSIIGVIDEIAFQTNLLALNAGVEAARAGEAGKGFAVVAQEVRELAQRSAKAAKDIKGLIGASSDEVRTGVDLVTETGAALQTIQANIDTVNDHMQAIASSSREQAVGLFEVNTAINEMDQVTQQNAAMAEESTAASATLVQETTHLRELLERFSIQHLPETYSPSVAHRRDFA
ncbi:methyl-accepting chemotaxis protein [Agrobacterium cavarae]|uniref:methyl-accepting chemotaxis protein n=1 Tax=Agrobacterium cavarae TaxID=2528239 RepID=UPI003EE5EF06